MLSGNVDCFCLLICSRLASFCYPSIERLVKDTCLNKKTVQAGLISLMKMGLISDTGERKGAT
ncbi:helix-turn-helix domain-containing protein, partial [Escherichia coli]|uniref:helix-turn-helix domain-containing protein n=1 Tax=Escherichia coli TaxID=562 RepID=UPI003EDF28F4